MNDHCPVCDESFRREPGFYYGAMYASYGLTVFFGLALFIIMVWALNMDILVFLITFTISIVLLMPVLYRLSRRMWINLFVGPRSRG